MIVFNILMHEVYRKIDTNFIKTVKLAIFTNFLSFEVIFGHSGVLGVN